MTVTAATIKERFPEFATVISGDVESLIAESKRQMNESAWGSKFDDGVSWLTAHLLLNLPSGSTAAPGSVTTKKVSKLSLSFRAGAALTDDALGSTAFGKSYLGLRKLTFPSRVL